MAKIKDQVIELLNKDVDISDEEYKKLSQEMDRATAKHGVEGKAPVSEAKRHRRMQMNFMGAMLNIAMNILAELQTSNQLLYLANKDKVDGDGERKD